jgi:hypothetical protein
MSDDRPLTEAEKRSKEVRSRGIHSNVNELSIKLAALRQDMADAGFLKTYQALDVATKALGWEAAEQLDRAKP